MNIGVIGLGKLGCSMFAAFSASGNFVYGYDINPTTRDNLRNKLNPVEETGLKEELIKGYENYKVVEEVSEVIEKSEVTYVIVPTPSLADGTFNTNYLEEVILKLKDVNCSCKDKLLVITSTVLPGDTRSKLITKVRNEKNQISKIKFCYSPEFIALGSVLHDLKNPDFLLVGEESPYSANNHISAMMTIVSDKNIPVRRMSIESAEMAKIAINSYITSKISFANAIGLTADSIENCCSNDVLSAIGSDSRIGNKYLSKGLGFGGPCFPRDNRAIQQVINRTSGLEYELPLDNEKFNAKLPNYYANKIIQKCNEENIVNIVIVGITYKDGSYLIEESQAYAIAQSLSEKFKVYYFDYDVIKDNISDKLQELNSSTELSGSILLLNCSREKKKMSIVKEIIENKNLNYLELNIWK